MKKILSLILFLVCSFSLSAQNYYSVAGIVRDRETGVIIENAAVSLQSTSVGAFTDTEGRYSFCDIAQGHYSLLVRHMGHMTDTVNIDLNKDIVVDIQLQRSSNALKEIVVEAYGRGDGHPSLGTTTVNYSSIYNMPITNLSKMLTTVPGVATMDIGAGVSKPVIRGLGFNRIAVINKGITQQNQQWGADHGMEISQFDFEYISVHKGASSLMYGSDAMSGAIDITPAGFRRQSQDKSDKGLFNGEAIVWGASNNDLYGGAFKGEWQKDKYFIRGVYSYQDFADYRVPADEFNYLSYNFPIYDRRLKNTAGRERNISFSAGYILKNVRTIFSVSDNYQKNGFFSGAHGIPDAANLIPDGSVRNIEMPYNTANHFTLTNNTEWKTSSLRLLINTGYQDNHRTERSSFHSHYGEDEHDHEDEDDHGHSSLEFDFRLKTYSTNARLFFDENQKWKKTIGMALEHQNNEIGGYDFFLPRFNQTTGGVFFINDYSVSSDLSFTGGLRYDMGKIDISGFYDDELAEYLKNQGYSPEEVQQYAQRALDVDRRFNSFSGSVGVNYNMKDYYNGYYTIKANIGKSYRFPTANELASNGVHHGAFRHEKGNPDLDAEQGYSFNLDLTWDKSSTYQVELNLFTNYFSNFIYLEPSKQWSVLPHAGQLYNYQQAEALFGGGEYRISWLASNNIKLATQGEYVVNKNLDNNYPLPFTPPFTMKNEISYGKYRYYGNNKSKLSHYEISLSHQWFADQNRIAQGEEKTPGTNLFNVTAGIDYKVSKKCTIRLNVQAQNIFDTRYMNHLSFYRKLNIPEPGRNIQVFVRIPFSS
ncbi:TonB-dependent receptor [Dysgonomonas sp. ZJ279]|uniref:TonB-dependent receptor n=1 Tax=Dysgonomonas sp. ZJ279 TaxID=2709796 RepID=UPI0013EB523B|nr:TonB-dependent receptor [Dysgonomonas sp. ZJ279]